MGAVIGDFAWLVGCRLRRIRMREGCGGDGGGTQSIGIGRPRFDRSLNLSQSRTVPGSQGQRSDGHANMVFQILVTPRLRAAITHICKPWF